VGGSLTDLLSWFRFSSSPSTVPFPSVPLDVLPRVSYESSSSRVVSLPFSLLFFRGFSVIPPFVPLATSPSPLPGPFLLDSWSLPVYAPGFVPTGSRWFSLLLVVVGFFVLLP